MLLIGSGSVALFARRVGAASATSIEGSSGSERRRSLERLALRARSAPPTVRCSMARIVLGAAASVAVYKSVDLASKLTQAGHSVRAVLTPRAAKLISPQLFAAVTGEPASVDEFSAERRGAMDHIELATWAELMLVAPCSAGLLARLALGLADDLLSTVSLALPPGRPRLVSPAMNPHMLASAPVQRNLATLRADGWSVIEPGDGHMACGVDGKGRLPDPAELVRAVEHALR